MPSLIMRQREFILKVPELIIKVWERMINVNRKNETALADNEPIKVRIVG